MAGSTGCPAGFMPQIPQDLFPGCFLDRRYTEFRARPVASPVYLEAEILSYLSSLNLLAPGDGPRRGGRWCCRGDVGTETTCRRRGKKEACIDMARGARLADSFKLLQHQRPLLRPQRYRPRELRPAAGGGDPSNRHQGLRSALARTQPAMYSVMYISDKKGVKADA